MKKLRSRGDHHEGATEAALAGVSTDVHGQRAPTAGAPFPTTPQQPTDGQCHDTACTSGRKGDRGDGTNVGRHKPVCVAQGTQLQLGRPATRRSNGRKAVSRPASPPESKTSPGVLEPP